jgi:hypothetical protein
VHVAFSLLIALAAVLAPFPSSGPSLATSTYHLYTRATTTTWPQIQPLTRPGDLIWCEHCAIPRDLRALTVSNFAQLSVETDSELSLYSAVNLDGEYPQLAQAYAEAPLIRAFIDAYNGRHPTTPLTWVAFYNLKDINANPSIVSYPDVVYMGKNEWMGQQIVSNAQSYVSLIRSYGRVAGVELTNGTHWETTPTYYTAAQILANFHAVIDPPPNGLGLSVVGNFYNVNNDATLLSVLQTLLG